MAVEGVHTGEEDLGPIESVQENGEGEKAEQKREKEEQKAKPQGPPQEIPFKEVKVVVEVADYLQMEKGKGEIIIDPTELEGLKSLIKKYGQKCGINSKIIDELDKMEPAQIMALSYKVLKVAEIVQVDPYDRERVKVAKNIPEGKMAVGRLRDVLIVQKYKDGEYSKRGGPGAAEAVDWTEDLPDEAAASPELRRYIQQIKKLKDDSELVQNRRLPVIEESLTAAVLKGEIADDDNAEAVKKVLDGRIGELSLTAAVEARGFIPEAQESEMRDWVEQNKEAIKKEYQDLDPGEQEKWVGEIERHANSYYKQIISGFGIDIPEAKKRLLAMAAKSEDPKGFRRWRAVALAGTLDTAVRVSQIFETPIIWEETPQKLSKIYSTVEATDLSIEEMSATVNQGINMIRNIEPGSREGRKMRDDLIGELEAFRAIHSLRIQLERHDMDPQNFMELYRGYFKDETLPNFVKRFNKDERQREFMIPKRDKDGRFIDKRGNPTEDISQADYVGVNLLDVSFELYSEKLRQERIKMNMIEEMTRHEIGNPFSRAEMRSFEEWLGIPLTDELKGQIEELRKYFKEKMEAKIKETKDLSGFSVDDIWGRKKIIKVGGKEIRFLDITHDVIEEWHNKKTLQGAFGIVNDPDIDLLMEEFGITDREEVRKRFLGRKFLDLRRAQILEQLEAELKNKGLSIRGADDKVKPVEFEALKEFGTLDSVDKNAYFFAWMMEWSSYDSIRIYSRDSKSKWRDDYDHLVYHASTNLFFGREIDQSWEFLTEENENRGRPKENDVNRIWKSFLPGKHSWVFPQNGTMTRWADFFMTKDQANEVEKRTYEMMSEWDMDNVKYHKDFHDWMRSVVKRDMIESGEISFGKGAGMKLSEVAEAEKLRKFEFIDLFIDRASHKKFVDPPILQDYLANPTEGKFLGINNKVQAFYSTRDARLFPWMTLALRAHWEVVNRHRERLFNKRSLNTAAGEELVNDLISTGMMERKQGEKEKRKLFGFGQVGIGGSWGLPKIVGFELRGPIGAFIGTTFFRRIRQGLEDGRRFTSEFFSPLFLLRVFLAGLWSGAGEFIKQFPRQITGGNR